MTATEDMQRRWDAVMMRTYGTPPLAIASGRGCTVVDPDGREYLDLLAGIAVSTLGHAHPAIVHAVTAQVARIAHTSNLAITEPALALSERLVELLGGDGRVFLCNDGATANEAAVKLALRARPGRRRFVSAEHSFHGRTLGALALTGKAAIREPFGPFGLDVEFVPYGDAAALDAALDEGVAAVVLEPTLGEAGVVPPPPGYLTAARASCDRVGALLVVDEVQGGIGRSGRWFAHEHDGVHPDVVTLAKGLAGGLPIGACVGLGAAGTALGKGDHGSTFGGNPVSCAAALAVLDTVRDDDLVEHARVLGERWSADLAALADDMLLAVRGRGLWLALQTTDGAAPAFESAARARGFVVNAVQPAAVRLAPPLVLSDVEADSFVDAVPAILADARALVGSSR